MRLPTNDQNWNAFHAAAVLGNPKTISKLISSLKKTVPVGLLAKDDNGNTPAHLAAIHGNLRALRVLIDACPEVLGVRNSKSLSVLDILRHCDDVPYTFELRTRLVAWGSASLGENSLGVLQQPELASSGVDRFRPRSIVQVALGTTPMVISQTGLDRHINMGAALKRHEVVSGTLSAPLSCTSAQHSAFATPEAVYAWGPNNHGQLGLEKSANTPTQLNEFLDYRTTSQGGFDALKGHERVPVEPVVGIECCAHYTVAYTTTKLYGWGLNSGQFTTQPPGKTKVTQFYGFRETIQAVVCLDKSVAVLVDNKLVLFENGEVKKTGLQCSLIKGRGRMLVVLVDNKLCVYTKELQRIPLPKTEQVLDFDVSETGVVVVATKTSVYTYKGGSVVEVPGAQRFGITNVACDARAASFIGVQKYWLPPTMTVKGSALAHDLSRVCPVDTVSLSTPSLNFSFFEGGQLAAIGGDYDWGTTPSIRADCDAFLVCKNTKIPVHKAVLLGRVPSLEQTVSTRRGCMIKREGNNFEFSQVSREALVAFVHYLYTELPSSSPANVLGQEYRDLQALVKGPLAYGLLRAKSIEPDVEIKTTDGSIKAHSFILGSRLDYFQARLSAKWKSLGPVALEYSSAAVQLLIDYLYSGDPAQLKRLNGTEDSVFGVLIELWFLCDELMYSQLAKIVESVLVETVSPETCLEVLEIMPSNSAVYGVAREFCARHMDYFIKVAAPNDTIENFYRKMYTDDEKPEGLAELVVELTPSPSTLSSTNVSARASPAASARASPAPTPRPSSSPSTSLPSAPLQSPASKTAQDVWGSPATPVSAPRSLPRPSPQAAAQASAKTTPIRMPWGRAAQSTSPSSSAVSPSLGSPAASLPQLGTSLPKLGSSSQSMRPRTTSVPRVSRVSQKERRRLQQDAPEPEAPSSSSAAPWSRQQTSTPLLSERIAMMRQNRTTS